MGAETREKRMGIITAAYDLMADKGFFSQAMYSRYYLRNFKEVFQDCHTKTVKRNTPKAYIYHCQKIG